MIFVLAKTSAVFVAFFGIVIFVLSLFIILMVLVQRGKGGGLAGALGGAGGQSAFGARATDQITWLTACTVALWILMSASAVVFLNPSRGLEVTAPTEDTIQSQDDGGSSDADE